jgi:hypothetical protein
MLICDEYKWIFLRNPKTASRSVSYTLKSIFVTRKYLPFHNWIIPKELSEYFIFTTVRNPYARVISDWKAWIKKGLKKHGKSNYSLNFEKFFEDLNSGKIKRKADFEWRRQVGVIDKIEGVHILRYESLEKDFNALPFIDQHKGTYWTSLGSLNFPFVLPQIGIQNYDDWQSYYTPDLEAKVYEFLKNDFERFGYKRLKF